MKWGLPGYQHEHLRQLVETVEFEHSCRHSVIHPYFRADGNLSHVKVRFIDKQNDQTFRQCARSSKSGWVLELDLVENNDQTVVLDYRHGDDFDDLFGAWVRSQHGALTMSVIIPINAAETQDMPRPRHVSEQRVRGPGVGHRGAVLQARLWRSYFMHLDREGLAARRRVQGHAGSPRAQRLLRGRRAGHASREGPRQGSGRGVVARLLGRHRHPGSEPRCTGIAA